MLPVLFEFGPIKAFGLSLGPFKVFGFGLMLGIAFLLGSYILAKGLARRGINPNIATTVTVLSVIFGISGAKILSLIEDWSAFIHDPVGTAFSPGGLTWYGGFALGLTAVYLYVRRKKVSPLKFLDALGVALILAYGVGRIGCHLSGDGDYGYPTTLPWGTIYAQGTSKPMFALEEYFSTHPDESRSWHYDSLRVLPGGTDRLGMRYSRFDAVTPLHPAPVYEFLMGLAGFGILLLLQKKNPPDGVVFSIYLMLASLFRFLIEFLRLNPRLVLGLSEAQLVSVGLFMLGAAAALYLHRKSQSAH